MASRADERPARHGCGLDTSERGDEGASSGHRREGGAAKLVQALPETFRSEVEATVIHPTRRGKAERSDRPALVDEIERAVVERATLRITYTSGRRESSERDVDP